MTTRPDDDDEDEKVVDVAAISRRAWFAGRQDGAEGGLESSAFRGVPTVPHGGSQAVRPEDTGGSYEYCWCGLVFDHDWPGKALGAPHPQKEPPMNQQVEGSTPRLTRSKLRAYHADLVDVILTAVNQYGVKYRLTGTKILLFPPDGTSPITINAANSDRQRRKVQQWFVRHCVPLDQPVKKSESAHQEVDADVVKELAEVLDSEEHLKKLDEPAKKAAPAPAMVATKKAPAKKAPAAQPPAEPETEVATPQVIDPNGEPGEWVPYMYPKGKLPQKPHEYFITNGVEVKCSIDGMVIAKGPAGTGGHTRTHHTDTTTLWGPEAKAKANESAAVTRLSRKVEGAIEELQKAIGVKPGGDTTELTKERDKLASEKSVLQTENAALKAEVRDLKKQIEDRDAKAELLREAIQGL